MKLVIVFRNLYCFFDAKVLGVFDTFLAQAAVVHVFDVNDLSLVVEAKHFPRTFLDECTSLVFGQLLVDLFLVELYDGLLPHDACRNWAPFCMYLSNSFLCNEVEI